MAGYLVTLDAENLAAADPPALVAQLSAIDPADSGGVNGSGFARSVGQSGDKHLNIVFAHDPGAGRYDGVIGTPNDIWNFVDLGTTAIDYTRYHDTSSSPARLRITRHDGEWGIAGSDGIFHGYIYHNCRCVDLQVKVLDLAPGNYTSYVFAHGDAPDQNAEIELRIGGRSVARKATAEDTFDFRDKPFREGLHFVRFEFSIAAGEELTLVSHRAASDYSMFNAIQFVQHNPAN